MAHYGRQNYNVGQQPEHSSTASRRIIWTIDKRENQRTSMSINCTTTVGDEPEVVFRVLLLLVLFAKESDGQSTQSRHGCIHMLRRRDGWRNDHGLGCRT